MHVASCGVSAPDRRMLIPLEISMKIRTTQPRSMTRTEHDRCSTLNTARTRFTRSLTENAFDQPCQSTGETAWSGVCALTTLTIGKVLFTVHLKRDALIRHRSEYWDFAHRFDDHSANPLREYESR